MEFYEPDWATRPPEKKPSVWAVMGGWLKQESFYRDIATRALSIAVVALTAYVYAVANGYVTTPPGRVIGPVAMQLLLLAALMVIIFRGRLRLRTKFLVTAVYMVAVFGLALMMRLTASPDPKWREFQSQTLTVTTYVLIALVSAFVVGWIVQDVKEWRQMKRLGTSSEDRAQS